MENHPPSPQACSANPPTESSFSFTPIKALSALPRLWDRKPSTPVRAGDKTRKLWKRIRFPFTGMNTATAAQASGIGASKNSDYQRGVKRLCVDPADADRETEAEQRGRSFLETKWEMQASRKRRKMPEFNFNIHEDGSNEAFGFTANQPEGTPKDVVGDVATNASPQPLSDLWKTSKTPVYNDAMATDEDLTASDSKTVHDLQSGSSIQDAPTVVDNAEEDKTNVVSTTESVQDLTQEQEIKLVRSALRSSLDGEDAALLNEFLSKANAKRAAKATYPEDAKSTEMSSSPEESPEVECSTPPRRVLEELTTNSPSPVKLQFSPSKYDAKRGVDGADDPEDIIRKDIKEEQAPSSPAYRRSTRTKGSSTPSMRNTISFRRAKGTEFVFQQRTESQQVAMATKRNTRINKGKSVTPMVALEALAQQSSEEGLQSDNLQNEGSNHKDTNSRGLDKPRKQVSWNEERMAEYEEYKEPMDEEDEEGDRCTNDVGATPRPRPASKCLTKKAESGHRSSRSQTQKAADNADSGASESGPTAPTTAPATLTPRSRRVRRLGDSGILGSGTPVKTGSRSTSKPPAATASIAAVAPSTPTKGRRKLAPKSPISSKLPARASTRANKTTDQPFVSGIPTRSSQSTDDGQRQSMLQMSAGCTPTARRVRSRS
ncbi:hypothetical protein N7489_011446 [Penicillium chrysogenum]|uniref:Uncharacterized protein n=1 Tax=Penicillium chrysogenum TaxID=5076 RepID=A0ABQ8W1K4_PENCH|nr:uncharacterized protein N7489_011446 [Penicillium chrysogenum]KAJ5230738.1 hypothetical protein N7489_011446 [Penicillium chrysogenum]KAJ5254613.1 hypothetical protein N7505_011822 [Penicillium chrysogenum]KAJ5268213.1 hypothetical protein N7524_005672 [Penicillium chrysogenum]KAJ6163027.1 hypothetical protein N7497_003006 [Penicillium chrysogenum]